MSDAMDKVQGVKQLPLFPLPLVLLPNELLPLHIYEPRYRQMLKDIQLRRNLFGITFFDSENEIRDKPVVGTVGCVAEVREFQLLPDGRSNIMTSGVVRYRLLDYTDTGTPYFTGEVQFFEDKQEDVADLRPTADEVYGLFERAAKAAFKLSGNRGKFPEIPHAEPEPLSFLVSAAFNLDNELKYRLLETTSTLNRLDTLREMLNQAVDQMEENADIHKISQSNGHSSKKIDL